MHFFQEIKISCGVHRFFSPSKHFRNLANQSPQQSVIKSYSQLKELRKKEHKIYPVTNAILDVHCSRDLAWGIKAKFVLCLRSANSHLPFHKSKAVFIKYTHQAHLTAQLTATMPEQIQHTVAAHHTQWLQLMHSVAQYSCGKEQYFFKNSASSSSISQNSPQILGRESIVRQGSKNRCECRPRQHFHSTRQNFYKPTWTILFLPQFLLDRNQQKKFALTLMGMNIKSCH